MLKTAFRLVVLLGLLGSGPAGAEVPWTFTNNTRYLALGDSLAAGFGALPTTQGYAYLLYQKGTYDSTVNTIFANAAVPGATSADVLAFQVPQAVNLFQPHVITLSAGGNDLLSLLGPVPPTPACTASTASRSGRTPSSAPSTRLWRKPAPKLTPIDLKEQAHA